MPCGCALLSHSDYGYERRGDGNCRPAFWFNPSTVSRSCSQGQNYLNSTGWALCDWQKIHIYTLWCYKHSCALYVCVLEAFSWMLKQGFKPDTNNGFFLYNMSTWAVLTRVCVSFIYLIFNWESKIRKCNINSLFHCVFFFYECDTKNTNTVLFFVLLILFRSKYTPLAKFDFDIWFD